MIGDFVVTNFSNTEWKDMYEQRNEIWAVS